MTKLSPGSFASLFVIDTRIPLLAILVLLQVLLSTSIYNSWFSSTPSPTICPSKPAVLDSTTTTCGPTLKHALQRNCILDVLAQTWTPPLCHDVDFLRADTVNRDPAEGNRTWFLDMDSTHPVRSDDLADVLISQDARGERLIAYVERPWHLEHCMFMFRLAAHAATRVANGEKDIWIDERAVNPDYTLKCQRIVLGQVGLPKEELEKVSRVEFGLGKCVKVM